MGKSRWELEDSRRALPEDWCLSELDGVLTDMEESWRKVEERELLGALRVIVHILQKREGEENE